MPPPIFPAAGGGKFRRRRRRRRPGDGGRRRWPPPRIAPMLCRWFFWPMLPSRGRETAVLVAPLDRWRRMGLLLAKQGVVRHLRASRNVAIIQITTITMPSQPCRLLQETDIGKRELAQACATSARINANVKLPARENHHEATKTEDAAFGFDPPDALRAGRRVSPLGRRQ